LFAIFNCIFSAFVVDHVGTLLAIRGTTSKSYLTIQITTRTTKSKYTTKVMWQTDSDVKLDGNRQEVSTGMLSPERCTLNK